MTARNSYNQVATLMWIGLAAWLIPGGGHFLLGYRKRAAIMCITIVATFGVGIYVGSIGVIDPVHSWPWFIAQVMTSPAVAMLGRITAAGNYPVYGRPNEIGQIYTSIAGLLNLLCIVNAIHTCHMQPTRRKAVL